MASHFFIGLLIIACVSLNPLVTSETRVELTSPIHPVTVGDILAIQCQAQQMKDGHIVDLVRVLMNGRTDPLSLRGNYVSQSSL